MKLPAYVHLSRHNVYVFRRRIPSNLLHYFKTNELRVSLATKCIKDATARARIFARDSDIFFYSLEHNMPIDNKSPFMQRIENKKKELYQREKIEQLENMLVESAYIRTQLVKQHERDIENIKTFMPTKAKTSATLIKVPKLSEMIENFFAPSEILRRGNKPATIRKDRDALNLFLEIVGDKPINEVVQSDASLFSDVVATYKRDGIPRAANTINNYLGSILKFSEWIVSKGAIYGHVTLEMKKLRYAKKKAPKDQRKMIEVSEIRQIFDSEQFKKAKIRDIEKYWLILVAIYTGMRLEEISQLNPKTDFYRDESGLLIFDINENDGKSLKNLPSARKVPVHDKLIELGLVAYVDSQKAKSDRLFPNSKVRDGRTGKNVGKRANYLISKVLGGDGKSLHSFRHTFTTLLKRAKVEEAIAAAILGHKHGKITYERYGKNFLTELLHDEMHKHIKFEV